MADDRHPSEDGIPAEEPPASSAGLTWRAPPAHHDDDEFKVWIAGQPKSPNHMGLTGATIKRGDRVCKTVSFGKFGDGTEITTRELRVKTSPRKPGGGYDFTQATHEWHCENDEIDKLLAFLKSDVDQPGRYRIIDATSSAADVVDLLESSSPDELAAVTKLLDGGTLATALSQSAAGAGAAQGAVLLGRRQVVARLKALVADPATTESKVQPLVENEPWLFGGRYVGVLPRRDLLPLDQHDIPLITADGCLHIIELKGPNIPKLIHDRGITGSSEPTCTSR